MHLKSCLIPGLIALASVMPAAVTADVEVAGKVKVELYTAGRFVANNGQLSGTTLDRLTGAPSYPATPTVVVYSPVAEFPFETDASTVVNGFRPAPSRDVDDNYGLRMSGFLRPPASGTWYFYVASDGASDLWISTDDQPGHLTKVAQEDAWSSQRYYFNLERSFPGLPAGLLGRGGNQRDDAQTGSITADGRYKTGNVSDGIPLVAGRKYYFEAHMKAGVGGDNFSIWATQDKNPLTTLDDTYPDYPDPAQATGGPSPLTGDWISASGPEAPLITKQPASQTNTVGSIIHFEVQAVPGVNSGALSYRWFANDEEVLTVDGKSVNSPVLDSLALGYTPTRLAELADDQSQWRVAITPATGTPLASTIAGLTVVPDVVPPQIVRVTPSDSFRSILIDFDGPLAAAGIVPGHFLVDGVVPDSATLLNPSPAENSRVRLHTVSPYTEDATVTLSLTSDILDLAGNPPATNTQVFTSYLRRSGYANYLRFEKEPGELEVTDILGFRLGDRLVNETVDSLEVLNQFGHRQTALPDVDNFYGVVRGWIVPPVTGSYEFFLSSSGAGVLWLSADDSPAGLKAVAVEPTGAGFGAYLTATGDGAADRVIRAGDVDATASNLGQLRNRSGSFPASEWPGGPGAITLEAGHKYYALVMHHAGVGTDAISVGVKKYGAADTTVQPLAGSWLEGFGPKVVVPPSLLLSVSTDATSALLLTWEGTARLTTSSAVDGPYTESPGASSPFKTAPGGTQQFYRLQP